MDEYLDQYIENVLESQQFRSGIRFAPSWFTRFFSRKN